MFEDFRGFRRAVYVVSIGQFINLFGSGVVYPFATLYFYGEVGIPLTLIGIGLLANNVATALGTTVGGYLADRYGRKPVLVASMALSLPTLAAYALVHTAPAFVVVATGAGLSLGLFPPASQAIVADLTPRDDHERAFGLLKVANNAGFGTGFVVGGVLYGLAKTTVFVVDGVTCGLVALLLWFALPRTHSGDHTASLSQSAVDWSRAVTHPTILWLAFLNVGFAVCYAQMQSTVPVFAGSSLGLSSEQIGTLYVLNPLVVVLFQLPVVSIAQRWRRTRGLLLSTGFWAASFVAITFAHWTPRTLRIVLVGAFLVLRTVGELLHSPIMTALASDVSHGKTRGTQLSVIGVAKRLGFGLGSVVGGAFFDAGVERFLWPALVCLCLLIALGILALEVRVPSATNGQTVTDN